MKGPPVAKRKIPTELREALWLAHGRQCVYTSEPLAFRDMHVDHILPERLEGTPEERARVFEVCRVPADFDLHGPTNLVPVHARANLQKGGRPFDPGRAIFYLELAERRALTVAKHRQSIERRKQADNARIALLRLRDAGQISEEQFARMLDILQTSDRAPFELLEQLRFGEGEPVTRVEPAEIDELRDRVVQLGANTFSGVELTHDDFGKTTVYTCREYDEARAEGYYPYTTFDIKMATFFVHQCGLLRVLETATTPTVSYLVGPPRRGITDLDLIPYDLFPHTMEDVSHRHTHPGVSFQDKVNDGTLRIERVQQNLLCVCDGALSLSLVEAARADLTGNGTEDMLVFRYDDYIGGTLGVGSTVLLTRASSDGLFDIVADVFDTA